MRSKSEQLVVPSPHVFPESLRTCDHALVKVAKKIRVLDAIAWPSEMEAVFLDGWSRGQPKLPQPPTRPQKLDDEIAALDGLMAGLDRGHPIGNWLFKTAWSYRVAAQMLGQIGQPGFTRCSSLLYGRPDTVYRDQDATAVDAAAEVLTITDHLIDSRLLAPPPFDIPAEEFAVMLRERIGRFFLHDRVEVVLDPNLSSKATAGSRKINLRATALFSELDLEQLVQHEAFIHTATLLNGRRQPLASLGVGAPRTTRTQEGLATFSEIITGSIDITRLRRVALRVQLVKAALEGADFIEVFRGFLDAGQSEVESYRSAARVFRGGDVRGKICFTKDSAYLEGVLIVYMFILKVLQENRAELLRMLFAGRLTTGDVVTLSQYRDVGLVVPSVYVPPWAQRPQQILALMAFFTAAEPFHLDRFNLQRFVEYEDDVIAGAGPVCEIC